MSPPCAWCTPLRRTFSRYPSGWAGIALLVLRLAVAAIVLVESLATLKSAPPLHQAGLALLGALASVALAAGYLTPIVSACAAAQAAVLLVNFHAVVPGLLDSRLALIELFVMALVLAVLGPGAYSIDSRTFGLREVDISDKRRPGP